MYSSNRITFFRSNDDHEPKRRRNDNDDRRVEKRRSPDRRDRRDRDYDRRRDDRDEGRKRNESRRQRSRSKERSGGFRDRRRREEPEDESKYEWGRRDFKNDPDEPPKEKEKPNFGLSGKLTEETNTFKGVVIKYAEPPEAKIPKRRWRLYPFKGETELPVLYIHRQSGFLIGRDRKICDVAVDHPSCSKQHAALQFRLVPYEREDGSSGKRVRPYIIDLESANGTFVNNNKIDPKKYVELLEKDVIKFGFSTREYVLLHEASKDEEEDDNVEEVTEEDNKIVKEEATVEENN